MVDFGETAVNFDTDSNFRTGQERMSRLVKGSSEAFLYESYEAAGSKEACDLSAEKRRAPSQRRTREIAFARNASGSMNATASHFERMTRSNIKN